MWKWAVLVFVLVAGFFEGAMLIGRYGADVNHFDFSGPCSFRKTDHWGWLEASQTAAKPLRVLMVGPDLTFDNDLPGVLVKVASSDSAAPVRFEVR